MLKIDRNKRSFVQLDTPSLADIAVLLTGSLGAASHPGIPVYDSPREADLGGRIYRQLLLPVATVIDELVVYDTIPFQQAVTTPPPPTLKNAATCLKLGGTNWRLFRKQLHALTTTQESFGFDMENGE